MNEISQNRFNAYVSFTRDPIVFNFCEEKKWFENEAKSVFGTVILDYTDSNYSAILLGRNEDGKIQCIDVAIDFDDINMAIKWLEKKEVDVVKKKDLVFSLDEIKLKLPLFKPVVKKEKLDENFKIVKDMPGYSAARGLISEILPHFFDIDGNFINQFQTTGFSARLWELYLFCYFNEENLFIDRDYTAPDFCVSNGYECIGIEAVTVGKKEVEVSTDTSRFNSKDFSQHVFDIEQDAKEKKDNIMPIRFGSALFSKMSHTNKLGQHYWELPHISGKPFMIAIADFHQDYSMTWSQPSLITYLYGYRYDSEYDKEGNLVVIPHKIEKHTHESKEIDSGFFFKKGSENVSAILSTSVGTISKFSRIGKQSGFDENNITMIRMATFHDHDPNADKPLFKRCIIDEKCSETWGEGVAIYHNPNAKYPISFDLFSEAAQFFIEGEMVKCYMQEIHPYASFTVLVQEKKEQ